MDTIELNNAIRKQKTIIDLFRRFPEIIPDYVHYRGLNILFESLDIPIIANRNPLAIEILGFYRREGIYFSPELGKDIVIKNCDELFCRYEVYSPTSLPKNNKERNIAKKCLISVDLEAIHYIESDKFTNSVLINYILNVKSRKLSRLFGDNFNDDINIPKFFVQSFEAVVFEGFSYSNAIDSDFDNNTSCICLQEHCDGKIKIDDWEILFIILKQISVAIHMLNANIGFISGDLRVANIRISSLPIYSNIKYLNIINMEAPFTCKISNFETSSCMIKTKDGKFLRFFNSDKISNIALYLDSFKYEGYQYQNDYYYVIDHLLDQQIYNRMRHMGIPYYHSFDYYTFIISMLLNRNIYQMFFDEELLISVFWTPIWSGNYGNIVRDKISQHNYLPRDNDEMSVILHILRDVPLKCDAIDFVIDQLVQLGKIEEEKNEELFFTPV